MFVAAILRKRASALTMNQSVFTRPYQWALLLFAFCLPWSKSAVTVLIAILSITMVAQASLRPVFRKGILRHLDQPLLVPLLILFGIALAGVVYSNSMSDGFSIAKKFLDLPLAYLLLSVILDGSQRDARDETLPQRALLFFVAGVAVLDVIGFLGYLGLMGNERSVLPLAPMNMHHIWFANLNALGVYAALSCLFFEPRRFPPAVRGLLILFIVVSVSSILLSLSRTAWLGMLVTGIVLSFLYIQRKTVLVALFVAAVFGGALLYQFNPLVRDRVDVAITDIRVYASGDRERETSLGDRFLMWHAAARMFLESPILGVGTGDYSSSMKNYVRQGAFPERLLQYNQPHNLYLYSLAINGLLGLTALLFLFYKIIRLHLPVRRNGEIGSPYTFLALAVAIHYLAAGLTETMFRIFVLRFAFAFLMAVVVRQAVQKPLILKP